MLSQKPKEILHSKRANLYLLEQCRVLVKDGRVVFLQARLGDEEDTFWNIPIANTTCILLGTGTSITQAAVRNLVDAGVMIGFTGGGGTPMFAATEIEWLTPQSEYRPTEYVQQWLQFWFDAKIRLKIAKLFQEKRIGFLQRVWDYDPEIKQAGFDINAPNLYRPLESAKVGIKASSDVTNLLTLEGRLTKELYKYAANLQKLEDFTRKTDGVDLANQFLNHGNYLAYGLAATCLWVLGIPHGFAVMHGKTRRGALVFDVADLIKDGIVLPLAFIHAASGSREQDFRQSLLQGFTRHGAHDFMFNVVKEAATHGADLFAAESRNRDTHSS